MKPFFALARTFAAFGVGLGVLISVFSAPTPARASGMPVFDAANFFTNSAQTIIQETLNGIAWATAKMAIQSMTKSIVNWINSGYEGEPAFSQNLQRDLRQVGDAAAGIFLEEVNEGLKEARIKSPFLAEAAQFSVNAYFLATSDDLLAQRLKYTLADYARDSVAYMRGDWSQGGLRAWHSTVFQCGNDPICVSFTTQEQLLSKIDAEVNTWLRDFNNGRGFLSWRGECKKTRAEASMGGRVSGSGIGAAVGTSLSDEDACIEYDVKTPGSVVEETLGITVNSPLRQLEIADSINEIVGAVVMQMMNEVLGGGGLSGLSSPRSNGTRPIDQATNPNTTNLGAGFESVIESEREKTLATKTAWTQIREAAVRAQEACPVAGGVVSAFRSSLIEKTISRADAIIIRADSVLQSIETILTLLEEVGEPSLFSSAQASGSQRAWEAYQRLLSRGELLTAQEHSEAATERSEEEGSNSLYLRMQEYAEDCD